MVIQSKNRFGEEIAIFSDLTLNISFWDCECEHNFIHPNSNSICMKCLSNSENQPNSRENEIEKYYKRLN